MPFRFLCSFLPLSVEAFLERSFGAAGCTQTSDSVVEFVLASVFCWTLDCVLTGSAAGLAGAGAGVGALAA